VRELVERQSPTEAAKLHPAYAEAHPSTNRVHNAARAGENAGGTQPHKATVHKDGSIEIRAGGWTREEQANSGVTAQQLAKLKPSDRLLHERKGM